MIEYPDLEQGSPEWLQARCGVITASVVGKLLTPTLKVASNDGSRGLITTLAAERITGRIEEVYVSRDMERGTEEEPFARDAYAAARLTPVREIGFITTELDGVTCGYSPDGLVAQDGLIEIKSRRQKTHIEIVLADEAPPQHMAQMQMGMLVSGRSWCDYVDFSNGMHLFVKRVHPDPAWQTAITAAVTAAEEAITDIVTRYTAATANLPATERIKDLEEMRIA